MSKDQISIKDFKDILIFAYIQGYEKDMKVSILIEEIKDQLLSNTLKNKKL
ncbi:hypothetical protein [Heyndrickxia oleronia]|uniref:hypothetical protein n=1 Tax=Heyndrickxia oleronia TaxID=38875 RepID=UPI00242BA3AA|nr:hypothetical protein [Heyndrickxia oleronia]MCI1759851.1 hypothetical protein [Heyndrickxia oleronia]